MIADPVYSRAQCIVSTGITSGNATFDMVAFGEGSKTTRNLNVPATFFNYLAAGTLLFEHTKTKGGRLRSVARLDVTGLPASGSTIPGISASAYLVLDKPAILLGGQQDKGVVDAVLSLLFNALVNSRSAGNDSAFSAVMTDWYGGEP
jgi:hypothetical protein